MRDLSSKKCIPCERGATPFSSLQIQKYATQFTQKWDVIDHKKITHTFTFKNFIEAIRFVNKVADLAQLEGHHPDLHIHYNKVLVELRTYAIGGLSENDFILASKIEKIK